jgi:protein-arginine kinase activator protein McsA
MNAPVPDSTPIKRKAAVLGERVSAKPKKKKSEESSSDEEFCQSCKSSVFSTDPAKWIGCDKCPHWFHIDCLPQEDRKRFKGVSEKMKKKLAYTCKTCVRKNSKK